MISSKPTLDALPNRELHERDEVQWAEWYLDYVREKYGVTNPTEMPKHEHAWLTMGQEVLAPTSRPIANRSPSPAPRKPSAPVMPPGWVLQELFKKYGVDTYVALMDEEFSRSERAQAKAARSQLGIKNPTSRDLLPFVPLQGPLLAPDSMTESSIDLSTSSQTKGGKRLRRTRATPPPSDESNAARKLLYRLHKYNAESVPELRSIQSHLASEDRFTILQCIILFPALEGASKDVLNLLAGNERALVPNPKKRPDIPTPMCD